MTLDGISRRGLLKGISALALSSVVTSRTPAWAKPGGGTILAYIGTYTPNGQGIHLFDVDPAKGDLRGRSRDGPADAS